jgi:hypothetical protein
MTITEHFEQEVDVEVEFALFETLALVTPSWKNLLPENLEIIITDVVFDKIPELQNYTNRLDEKMQIEKFKDDTRRIAWEFTQYLIFDNPSGALKLYLRYGFRSQYNKNLHIFQADILRGLAQIIWRGSIYLARTVTTLSTIKPSIAPPIESAPFLWFCDTFPKYFSDPLLLCKKNPDAFQMMKNVNHMVAEWLANDNLRDLPEPYPIDDIPDL